MAVYKVLFHPLEEYFFGEDGSFREGVKNAEYFIASRLFPSQTTLFGILRYLNLKYLKERGTYSAEEKKENGKAVGEKSFCMESAMKANSEAQNFGTIKGMSAVFLHVYDVENKVSRIYVAMPKDAKGKPETCKSYKSVFDKGEDLIATFNGEKTRPEGYDAKEVEKFKIESSFISIDAGIGAGGALPKANLSIIESPFKPVFRTGLRINRRGEQTADLENSEEPMSSLFKKAYIRLKQEPGKVEYSFGVYAEIENDAEEVLEKLNRVVGMGLGGSLFAVKTSKIEEVEQKRLKRGLVLNVDEIFENHIKKEKMVYCISPCYVDKPNEILMKSEFSALHTVENRPMSSGNIDEMWKKPKTLYRMMDSGSVLIMDRPCDIAESFEKKGLQQIGYNHYYIGGKK